MTEKQLDIADAVLQYLADHEGRTNDYNVPSYIEDRFGYDARLDYEYVYQLLRDDYHLVAPMGAFITLTAEGAEMAKRGMRSYQKKLSFKEQVKVAKSAIAIIASICTILSAIITAMIALLWEKFGDELAKQYSEAAAA